MKRLVLDTNVVFSALAFDKNLEILFNLVLEDKQNFLVFRSESTTAELELKLKSKKFLAYRDLSLAQISEILKYYFTCTILCSPNSSIKLSRDPKDNKFLELAKTIQADFLITGDKDLLELESFEGTIICKPSEFLNQLNLNL